MEMDVVKRSTAETPVAAVKRPPRTTDLGPSDWLEAGQALLKSGGLRALKLRPLADALAVSTGSFYHHFRDFDGYHAALADYFAGAQIDAMLARLVGSELAPVARIQAFADWVQQHELAELSLAMRAWAKSDARAAAAIVVHDDKVMDFIAVQLVAHGLEREEAAVRAYALMSVGLGEIHVPASLEIDRLRKRLMTLLCAVEGG